MVAWMIQVLGDWGLPGIFLAASLHAAAALPNVPYHEFQHSVVDNNLRLLKTTMRCDAGFYYLPEGPGLGVEPSDEFWKYASREA